MLLQRGFTVRCLLRPSRAGLGWLEGLPVEIVHASLFDPDALERATRNVDYIVHIAGVTKAKRQREFHEGNVTTTRNLLEAAAHTPRLEKFCYISSLTAAGPSPDGVPLDEHARCQPITTYGVSKLEAETLCQLYSPRVPIVILRPPAVYGPRDHDVLQLCRWIKSGIKPILGSRKRSISVIHVTDLAGAIADALVAQQTKGETYFVSDEQVYSFAFVVDTIARSMAKRTIPLRAPAFLVYGVAGVAEFLSLLSSSPTVLNIEKARNLLQRYWICSPKKIRNHIGFEAKIPLEEGLKTTLEWYRSRGWL